MDNDRDLAAALGALGGDGVLKTRRLGYDGKGQRVFRNAADADAAGVCAAMGGVPLILESFVPFAREISVIAARAQDGALAAYDPAENVHRDGILHSSTVPAAISPETAAAARAAAFAVMQALSYVGVIGVEFFVMADGSLVANEIAPGCTIPATGRRRPARSRSSSSTSARSPACRSAKPRATRTASWKT